MAALRPGETVLDVACGTGLVTFPAAKSVGSAGSVLGTDISEEMVESARLEAARQGLTQTSFERMGAEAIEVETGSYDVVLCSLGLMYVPDPDVALAEVHRVLRSGGRTVQAVWGARKRCGWADIFPIVDSRVQSDVCPMFFLLGTGNNLAGAFERAGFSGIRTRRLDTVLHYDSAEDACAAAFAGGPVAMAYSRFDEDMRREAQAEYISSIEPYRVVDGSYQIPGEFVVASALKP